MGISFNSFVKPVRDGKKAAPVVHGSQVFDVAGNYNFVVPAGVTQIFAIIAAAGGGGGSWSFNGGGGGGAGGTYIDKINVTPLSTLAIVVGAGGVKAVSAEGYPETAGTGGNSSIGSYIAYGGTGGQIGTGVYYGGTGGVGGGSFGSGGIGGNAYSSMYPGKGGNRNYTMNVGGRGGTNDTAPTTREATGQGGGNSAMAGVGGDGSTYAAAENGTSGKVTIIW